MALCPLFQGQIGIWKCWFLWREENHSTCSKTLGAGMRTNKKLNPHKMSTLGIEGGPIWKEKNGPSTVPSLLPSPPSLPSPPPPPTTHVMLATITKHFLKGLSLYYNGKQKPLSAWHYMVASKPRKTRSHENMTKFRKDKIFTIMSKT